MQGRYLIDYTGWLILTGFLCSVHFHCAARGRPGGGPVDQVPPRVVVTFPATDSTSIKNLSEIKLVFSERMDDASVKESIFISPRLKYEPDWSGWTKLFLEITDTLRSNVTYVVTIGSGARDLQRNRMKESFQLAFSTGPKIDRGKISGKVYHLSKQDIFYIYAYKMTPGDTINPMTRPADYLSQPGEDGQFLLNYLAPGTYRVFVIEDVNKNALLDLNFERVGIPSTDVQLDSGGQFVQNLNFTVTRIDTTPPTISGARALNNRTVLLRCSEVLKSLTKSQLIVCDSLKTDTLRILSLAPNKDDSKQYYLYTVDQPANKIYYVTADSISDSSGNRQILPQTTPFLTSSQVDTTVFKLLQVSPQDSAARLSLASAVSIELSKAVDTTRLSRAFTLQNNQNLDMTGHWIWQDLKKGFFTVDEGFQPGKAYSFKLNSGELRSVWGDTLADTTITHTFFILSEDELGSLSGRFISEKPLLSDIFLDILSLRDQKKVKRIQVDADNTFQANWLTEGYYKLSGFVDTNHDGEYTAGSLFPFRYAEPYYMQSDTIRIRKRWETENIIFTMPGVN